MRQQGAQAQGCKPSSRDQKRPRVAPIHMRAGDGPGACWKGGKVLGGVGREMGGKRGGQGSFGTSERKKDGSPSFR